MVHDNDSKKFLTNWQKKSPINIQVIYSYRYFKWIYWFFKIRKNFFNFFNVFEYIIWKTIKAINAKVLVQSPGKYSSIIRNFFMETYLKFVTLRSFFKIPELKFLRILKNQ